MPKEKGMTRKAMAMTTAAAERIPIHEKQIRPIETIAQENGEYGGERRELKPISNPWNAAHMYFVDSCSRKSRTRLAYQQSTASVYALKP